jgi:hypothetical protein
MIIKIMDIQPVFFVNGISLEYIQDSLSTLTPYISYLDIEVENSFYKSNLLKLFSNGEECINYIIEMIGDSDMKLYSKIEESGKITINLIIKEGVLSLENITHKIRICNVNHDFYYIIIKIIRENKVNWKEYTWIIDGKTV